MEFLPISFLAGILTILAPCILPLLPVIIGGSLTEQDKKRPLIITASLALSIIVFTLLLKVSTAFIDIPQSFWTWFSASIVFIFALTLLFPDSWAKLSLKIMSLFQGKNSGAGSAQKTLFKLHDKKGFWPAVALGGALGPVFASCSPTYFLILGTVLPANFSIGLLNLVAYSLGLALVMFLVAYAGQKFTKTLNIAANPKGWFKKGLGVLFLLVAIAIAGGYDKQFSTYILDKGFFDVTKIEEKILENQNKDQTFEEQFDLEKKEVETESQEEIFNTNIPAPEIEGLTNWINSNGYNSLEELKGKVVLVDFWTYSCINCIRTLPHLQSWHEKYADEGLVILGIHAPEFAFEKKAENVQNAVDQYGLEYPVVQDNDFTTWGNYKNKYWPAKYLIDKEGNLRYYHFGEGEYDTTEKAITTLLNTQTKEQVKGSEQVSFNKIKTRETYLGSDRRKNFSEKESSQLDLGEWNTQGAWKTGHESISIERAPAEINLQFHSSKVNLVLDGNANLDVYVDGEFHKNIKINGANLYRVFESDEYKERTLSLKFKSGLAEAFAFTFG